MVVDSAVSQAAITCMGGFAVLGELKRDWLRLCLTECYSALCELQGRCLD